MRTAISIFGQDRPGIIASLTNTLSSNNVNIEDAAMTILHGHFAMILVADSAQYSAIDLEALVLDNDSLSGLSITFSEVHDLNASAPNVASRYVFHLVVADSPGIVARVTQVLADSESNIVDCATRKSEDTNLFTLVLDVDVPQNKEDSVVSALGDLSQEFSGDIVFHRVEDVDL